MSREIIGYRFFRTNEEFEEWQLNNGDKTVCTIAPCPKQIGMSDNKKPQLDMNAQVELHVFVTYRHEARTTISK